jgi:hypothetical protein
MDWEAIARHLGRGKRSVQRKYDNLKGSSVGAMTGTYALPLNDGKKWASEDVEELLRLVDDGAYRMERLGMEKVGAIGGIKEGRGGREGERRWACNRDGAICRMFAMFAFNLIHSQIHCASRCSFPLPPLTHLPPLPPPPDRLEGTWPALWAQLRECELQVQLCQEHRADSRGEGKARKGKA